MSRTPWSRINYKYTEDLLLPKHEIRWNIPDFLHLVNIKIDEFLSDECFFTDDENSRKPRNFELKIRFYGQNTDLIEIYFLSRTSVLVMTNLTIAKKTPPHQGYLPEGFNQSFVIKKDTIFQTAYANTWHYLTSLYTDDSVNEKANICNATSYDGSLDLRLKFTIDNSVIPVGPILYEEDNQFTNNFEDLFISGLYSDIVMKSADNIEFQVHKAVLASRSAVLKAHFEHNTIECQTNIVGSPLDSDVLKEVLTFIYSDKAPRVDEMPEKLLAAGDYYQLGKLKNLAAQTLYEKLTVNNAVETLQLANLHSDPNLKEWTMIYIKNAFSSVQRTDGWAKLNSVELMKTLCEYIANKGVAQ